MPKNMPYIQSGCISSTTVDLLAWSEHNAFYSVRALQGFVMSSDFQSPLTCINAVVQLAQRLVPRSISQLRLNSRNFAMDEEHRANERHVPLNSLPRAPAYAPGVWHSAIYPHSPITPASLLRRLFSIRGVLPLFLHHIAHGSSTANPTSPRPPKEGSDDFAVFQLFHHPESWPSARFAQPNLSHEESSGFSSTFDTLKTRHWSTVQNEIVQICLGQQPRPADLHLGFEHLLDGFEACRLFLSAFKNDCGFDFARARSIYSMPIPTEMATRRFVELFERGFSIAATLFWRVYHLHQLLEWSGAIEDPYLAYWTQLYLDSHLSLWSIMEHHQVWSDEQLFVTRTLGPIVTKAPAHSMSPENLADRTRYINGSAHHLPLRGDAYEFPRAPQPNRPRPESICASLYELWYPSDLSSRSWHEAPDLSRSLLDGYVNGLRNTPLAAGSELTHVFASVLYELLIHRTKRTNKSQKSVTAQLKNLYRSYPGCRNVLLECAYVSMLGNLPTTVNIHRPNFTTRLRLHGLFLYDPRAMSKLDELWPASFVAHLRSYTALYFKFMPALYKSLDDHHVNMTDWMQLAHDGANKWRRGFEFIPYVSNSASLAQINAAMKTLEDKMLVYDSVLEEQCCAVVLQTDDFATAFLELLTEVYQQIRRKSSTLIDPLDLTPKTPLEGLVNHGDDKDVAELVGLMGDLEIEGDEAGDDDDDAKKFAPFRLGRRMKEVKHINDTVHILQYVMTYLPVGYNDELMQSVVWRVCRRFSPNKLPTFFLSLLGVSDYALQFFRQWMFWYHHYDISPSLYSRQINTLWLQDPCSVAVIWRYLFFYTSFRCEIRIPQPLHIQQAQVLARRHSLGVRADDNLQTKARRLIFHYCSLCRAWDHPIAPTASIVHHCHPGTDGESDTFADPIDVIRERSFSSKAWKNGREKKHSRGELAVGAIGIYGASPTASAVNGTGRSTAIHTLNTRGSSTPGRTATSARLETTKPHASGTVFSYYDPLQPEGMRYFCSRAQARNGYLIIHRAAWLPIHTKRSDSDFRRVQENFNSQFKRAIPGFVNSDDVLLETSEEFLAKRLRAYITEDTQARRIALGESAVRARRCGNLLLQYDLTGAGCIVDGRHFVVCGACACLTTADPRRYVPELGWVCARHGITARGFDPMTGNLVVAPDVVSPTTNTLDRYSASGRLRLTPVLIANRLPQVMKLPLAWLFPLGVVSFLDYVDALLFPQQHNTDKLRRVVADLHSHRLSHKPGTPFVVPIINSSAGGSHIIEMAHPGPVGLPIRPHTHLHCRFCPASQSSAFTILMGGGRIRVCQKHSSLFLQCLCFQCKTQIGPWEKAKSQRLVFETTKGDEKTTTSPIPIYLCLACTKDRVNKKNEKKKKTTTTKEVK